MSTYSCMTSLGRGELVRKNHPRIVLRGQLDLFRARLMLTAAEMRGYAALAADFESVFTGIRAVQRAETTDQLLEPVHFLGMSYDELQLRSHNPREHYGIGHMFGLGCDADLRVLRLNELRAMARALEIAAVDTFTDNDTHERADILTALNRLSSALYIMQIKAAAGQYN